ncbi:MAG: DNA topoisomerase IV subunit A [Rickettsiales bacterium]|nr:MAG: DNA topoisomerase IV subunit A [Rickettsiales bacterium]
MTNKNTINNDSNVENIDFGVAISERYLSYALSTIMSRSLPDVRDGLKPVHRRLLYAMMKLKLDPSSGYKKCARIVGDVIGKYHPHGDIAIYDTLVRLAQTFSLRYPLIDGQGNFGSIDGDNAAAMRYTESRMTEICTLLMQDLDKDTVDFTTTYDDSDIEPTLMPAQFPNLLANGSEGIAVGMATSIPPHNLHELCDALIHIIDNPDNASSADLMQYIKGPDFPTGGIIIDSADNIRQAYETGRGSFKIRAKWEKEVFSHGLYQIVITEIPYQIQKSKLIEAIAQLLNEKKIPLIGNIRDESDENIRIIIEPKGRNISPEIIMESLFKLTALESRASLNMNVLSKSGVPRVMNIKEVLQEFLDHRQEITLRRTKYQIRIIDDRLELLAALKIAYLNIDEVIRIIREEDDPKQELIKTFNINANQAESILNIKLRSLRKLEEEQINAEHDLLQKQLIALNKILDKPQHMWKLIKSEILDIQKKFSLSTALGARRTNFQEVENNSQIIDISAFIEKEPITIICSKMGWVRAIKNHGLDLSTTKFKEGDSEAFIIETYTTSNILICSTGGKFFTVLADNFAKGKGHGESIKLMVDIENHDVINMFAYVKDQKLLLASNTGRGFIVSTNDVLASTKSGKQIMQIKEGVKCVSCIPVNGDMLAIIGTNRKLLVFALNEVPEMKRGQGVRLQKYTHAMLSDIKTFNSNEGLSWSLGNKIRLETQIMSWRAKRGGVGKIPPTGFPKNNKFS